MDQNFKTIIIEALFLGILFGADPFLSVFLARLGASTFEISLLTSMSAIGGLVLVIPIGSFLQKKRKIVPWYSVPRVFYSLALTFTGILPFFFVKEQNIVPILGVWALATIPQNILIITFNYVMNAAAGAQGRYTLMATRWGIIGTTSALALIGAGWFLERVPFPYNYQVLFITLSLAGFAAFQFGHRIQIPDQEPPPPAPKTSLIGSLRSHLDLLKASPAFVSFTSKRFLFALGTMLTFPLFPIYFVREVHASDYWIGIINTAQMAANVVGYFFWMRQSKKRNSHSIILLITMFASTLYPILVASTLQAGWITVYAGIIAIFQAGLDLAFFDELMKNTPATASITYISIAQTVQNVASFLGPMLGSFLANSIGIGNTLLVGAGIKFLAFLLFLIGNKKSSV